jgi:hypothetical protein
VVFANPGTSFVEAGRVAVQVLSKPVYCHGTEIILRAGAGVWVEVFVGFVLGAGSRKNHDEPINFTVRC